MRQLCSLNLSFLVSHCLTPETLAKCFLWEPVGSCGTKVEHSHLFCQLCTARLTICLSPFMLLMLLANSNDWLKVRGVCFWEDICSPTTPQLENKGNLGWVSYTPEVFSQKCCTHGTCPFLKYSSGRSSRPLLLKGFLISHQSALNGVLL